jgi:RND superfamily putative drug exporter
VPGAEVYVHPHTGEAGAIGAAMDRIAQAPHVIAVEDPLGSGQIAADGRTAFATVTYDETANELGAAARERLEKATAPLERDGVAVALSGQVVDAGNEVRVPVGELAGVLAAIVLLLTVLRSVRATLASLLTAFLGVGAGFTLLGLAATGADVPSLAPTMAAMLGIGAGIDYALLSAARHQEELRAGREPRAWRSDSPTTGTCPPTRRSARPRTGSPMGSAPASTDRW